MMVLSFDPGKLNYAYAIRKDGELIATGLLTPPLEVAKVPLFAIEEILPLFVKGEQEDEFVVGIERYQYRGRSSIHAEVINLTIGAIQLLAHQLEVPLYLITPSQWKVWLVKYIDKKDPGRKASRKCAWWWFYKPGTDNKEGLDTEHEADATGIGAYLEEYWLPKLAAEK